MNRYGVLIEDFRLQELGKPKILFFVVFQILKKLLIPLVIFSMVNYAWLIIFVFN